MGKDILKNSGRILFVLLFVFICNRLFAVEIETELTPSKIAAGESASLKIKITGKSGKVKPVKFPAVNGLQISFSGSSRSFQFINGKTWSGTVLSFSIYGEKKGEYKIPPFILEADGENVVSREVTLIVREPSSGKAGNGGGITRGDVALSAETVYSGEPFIMRYFIYDNGGEPPQIEGFSDQPHVKGFVMKVLDEKKNESDKTYVGSFCLVPVEAGVHEIGGGSVDVVEEMSQGFFSMSGRKRILFPRKKIKVIPIPVSGKPDKFNGDVGEFKIESHPPAGKFSLFEEIRIPVKVSGRGNLLTLSKPVVENEDGIKFVVEEKEQTLSVDSNGLTGEKNFLITVIPQIENDTGRINTGRIYIEYFNPYKKTYEKAESEPFSFEIKKEKNSDNKGEVQFSTEVSSGGKINYLIIILISAGFIISIVALVMWERKKIRMISSELKIDNNDETTIIAENVKDDILKNMQAAMRDQNHEMFLFIADKGINRINQDKLNAGELDKFNYFKEKVYNSRYGGGILVEQEMRELSGWLKKNLS